MGIEGVIYRDAPVNIKPLEDKIDELEAEIVTLKDRAATLESDVEQLKEVKVTP